MGYLSNVFSLVAILIVLGLPVVITGWNLLGIVFIIQIWDGDSLIVMGFFCLFHFNMLILSITHIHKMMKEHIHLLNTHNTVALRNKKGCYHCCEQTALYRQCFRGIDSGKDTQIP